MATGGGLALPEPLDGDDAKSWFKRYEVCAIKLRTAGMTRRNFCVYQRSSKGALGKSTIRSLMRTQTRMTYQILSQLITSSEA